VEEKLGKVTIAPNVLVTIVHKTAASVPGVAQLCDRIPGVKQFLGLHTVGPGVEVDIEDGQVSVEVYLIAKRDVDLLQMGRQLQREITRAIEHIVGMPVQAVNVHIEDTATELMPPLSVPAEGAAARQARGQWGEGTAR
jgi:uncharacterized alkaline shock family protein YloU